MSDLKLSDIRKAVLQLKALNRFNDEKGLKAYKLPIRNWPLFRKLKKAGKIYQTPSGSWDLK